MVRFQAALLRWSLKTIGWCGPPRFLAPCVAPSTLNPDAGGPAEWALRMGRPRSPGSGGPSCGTLGARPCSPSAKTQDRLASSCCPCRRVPGRFAGCACVCRAPISASPKSREAGYAGEAGQHFARHAHYPWALGPKAKAGRGLVVVTLLRLIVAHRGLPSVRTMRTFCCLSPPRRSLRRLQVSRSRM